MRIVSSTLLLVSGLLCCGGCGSTAIPEELKNLHPVTITVTDGTQPLEGIGVTLSNKGPQGAYGVNAMTDAQGMARIQTTRGPHTRGGAPPGTYAVVLFKAIATPPELEPSEADQDDPVGAAAKRTKLDAFLKENRAIPHVLTQSDTSPVELTVGSSATTLEVDIAKYHR
ncbi:MAG: hypothetical protein FWE95_03085 [Planctomycetaceae bacterium]|nr:hypothetical protein [Planctomycetaceae bacterium]